MSTYGDRGSFALVSSLMAVY